METFTDYFNALSAIGAMIFLVFGLIMLYIGIAGDSGEEDLSRFISKHALLIGFAVSLMAVIGSLIYSNVIGYQACELCWIQRIFIYPQAVLYLIALVKKDRGVFKYALWLSIIGIIVAIYNNYIILGGTDFIACSSAGASCAMIYVNEWGFVTIPFMSFSVLLALTSISAFGIKKK